MPTKLNKAGQMQDYIPKGNGDASGEYGTSNGTNKNFTTSDKKKTQANVITENKSVVVGDKKTTYKGDLEQQEISLKNRIENLEGVIKNIENGDPTGAEDLQDMKRRLKNYKEDYERQFGKDSNRLRKILEERNRNEDIDHAIDTDYFGFGSLDKLEEAHKNNYGRGKANVIDDDLSGVKKNDNLTPTNALKIENMNEAQLDNEIAKTQREIDRLDSVMKNNTKESELTKQFPLGVGGSGWSADRKKQFVKNIESETKQAKNFTDAYKDKESLKNRLDALNKAKEQVKGTGKTQEQLKQNVINNTQSTINWEKGKIANPYGKGEINVIKANGYEIRSVDNGFYSIYKDGKSVGNTNKLKDAKAYVERIVQKQSKANVIS